MEPVGAFLAEELGWLNRMFSGEDSDFMANVHCHNESSSSFNYGSSSTFWPTDEAIMNVDILNESLFVSSDTVGTNYYSQETSNSSCSNSSAFFSTPGENHFTADINLLHGSFNLPESMNFCTMDSENNFAFPHVPENFMEEEMANENNFAFPHVPTSNADTGKEMQLKRKFDSAESYVGEDEQNVLPKAPKKKPRAARNAPKGKKIAVAKKNQKIIGNGEDKEEANTVTNVQSSSSYSSEHDSNASQELNEGATSDSKGAVILNSNGKARASIGAATDPQSLYARKRRERINERLRILQNLVPNGMKVDISTMLEEAVDYVKFLQLQIKLLSSDDMWMYAPIAYNGMDMGLYEIISQRAL